jgi:HEAT repeat protein
MNFVQWKKLLASEDSSDRSHAADILPDDGEDEDVAKLLVEALGDSDELVRTCAADSLGNIFLDTARRGLRARIAVETLDLPKAYMLCSLGLIGDDEDLEILVREYLGKTTAQRVKRDAAEGLLHLVNTNLVLDMIAYTEQSNETDSGYLRLERTTEQLLKSLSAIEQSCRKRVDLSNSQAIQEPLDIILNMIKQFRRE